MANGQESFYYVYVYSVARSSENLVAQIAFLLLTCTCSEVVLHPKCNVEGISVATLI